MYSGNRLSFTIRKLFVLAFTGSVFFSLNSCDPSGNGNSKHDFFLSPDGKFANSIRKILKPVKIDSVYEISSFTLQEYVQLTYQLSDYKPIWITNGKPTENVKLFLQELEEVRYDGFDPEQYQLSKLKQLAGLFNTKGDSLQLAIALDTGLTHSFLDIAYDLLIGEVEPEIADPSWFHPNDTIWDAPHQLAGMGNKYLSLNQFRSLMPTYTLLRNQFKLFQTLKNDTDLSNDIVTAANTLKQKDVQKIDSSSRQILLNIIRKEIPWIVKKKDTLTATSDSGKIDAIADDTVPIDSISEEKHLIYGYQYYNGLKNTGKLDKNTIQLLAIPADSILKKLSINMERIRWLPHDFGNLYAIVDVPAMEFMLRQNGANNMQMRVVVGKPERPTPSIFALMTNIVINPTWGVPPTILKNDVLPGIQKSGKKYLAKKGLKVYDRKGKLVNAAGVNAKNYKRFVYRQDPGDDNSLGFIKFHLRDPFDIYLHDTPHRGDFVKHYRALSSGCIRLEHPQELALFILSNIEKADYDSEKLTQKIQTHKTQWISLKTKIPVHITYLTAFEDSTQTHLRLLEDVYKHDSLLISLMK